MGSTFKQILVEQVMLTCGDRIQADTSGRLLVNYRLRVGLRGHLSELGLGENEHLGLESLLL